MFIIGIDPHKRLTRRRGARRRRAVVRAVLQSCTLTAINAAAVGVGDASSSRARGRSRERPGWARCWPSSSSRAGEHVVDVPPKLSARVRLLDNGRIDKTDPNDARSAAIVAWRTRR